MNSDLLSIIDLSQIAGSAHIAKTISPVAPITTSRLSEGHLIELQVTKHQVIRSYEFAIDSLATTTDNTSNVSEEV